MLLERRYSDAANDMKTREWGMLFDKSDVYKEMYPAMVRKKKVKINCCHLFIHVALALYIGVLLYTFWRSWKVPCIRQLNVWLSVYFIVEVLQITICALVLGMWCRANDPTLAETKLYVFGTFWLYLFIAGWIIYGSTFIYSEDIQKCD